MRVAVLSDIHANLRALEAVLGSLGSVDAIWQLGDVVGYGPDPNAVIERLREVGARGVRGNHDVAALGGDEIDYFNPDARRAMAWTRESLSPASREWLDALPERLEDGDFTLAHGSPRDPIWEYLTSRSAAEANLTAFDTPYCLVGHTHVPVVFRHEEGEMELLGVDAGSRLALNEERAIINPGSVGQPRDGEPEASYVILDTSKGTATWRRIPYDVEATQAAMIEAGLPRALARRLTFGL